MSTLRVRGHLLWHGGQALGARALWVAPHDCACECAPLPVPAVCSRVASRHEPSGRSAREALACGVAWNTANTAVLAEGVRLLINNPARCEGVRAIGVDEHVWRHTPYGDKYVTVILDVTPVHDRSGPSRLLDMVPGRSKGGLHNLAGLPAQHVARAH